MRKGGGMTVGERLSRKLFELRGNHSEMHVSEAELAAILDGAIKWADETALDFTRKHLGIRPHNVGGCECADDSQPCTSKGRKVLSDAD
jgi:hypothetical protein